MLDLKDTQVKQFTSAFKEKNKLALLQLERLKERFRDTKNLDLFIIKDIQHTLSFNDNLCTMLETVDRELSKTSKDKIVEATEEKIKAEAEKAAKKRVIISLGEDVNRFKNNEYAFVTAVSNSKFFLKQAMFLATLGILTSEEDVQIAQFAKNFLGLKLDKPSTMFVIKDSVLDENMNNINTMYNTEVNPDRKSTFRWNKELGIQGSNVQHPTKLLVEYTDDYCLTRHSDYYCIELSKDFEEQFSDAASYLVDANSPIKPILDFYLNN